MNFPQQERVEYCQVNKKYLPINTDATTVNYRKKVGEINE